MTTTNNNAVNAAVNTSASEAAATAARMNIKVAMTSGNIPALVQYFADYAGDVEQFKAMKTAITEALKQVPAEFKARVAAAEEGKQNRIAGIQAAAQKRQALKAEESAKLQAARETEAAAMLNHLVDTVNGLGLDLEAATVAVDAAMIKKYGKVKGDVKGKERATVVVKGTEYQIPRSGNMSQELKDLVAANGGDREAFITKYEVKEESAE